MPDHCRMYALSYSSDKDFITKCDHEHTEKCDRCDIFPSVVAEVSCINDQIMIEGGDDVHLC